MAVVLPFLGAVIGIVAKFGEYLLPPVKRQFGYMCYNSSNIDKLRYQIEELEHMENGVKLLVGAAERNQEIIGEDVKDWIRKVDDVKVKVHRILEEAAQVQEVCLNGCGRNVMSRYSMGKNVHEMTAVVCELQSAGEFERVSYPAPPPQMELTTLGKGEEFKSRISVEEGIMEALKSGNIDIIRICGMGGVGKTRMVKRIGERAREENIFDEVVMAVVTQQSDSRRIQTEIADWLGLKFMEQNLLVRARRLDSRLKTVKRILVILDDVWSRIDLEEVGIPHGNVHTGCKILLTSRNRDVCIEMNAYENIFTVNPLSSEEAWFLFKDKAGESVNDPDLNPLAIEIADECKGLPIALITVGSAIKRRKNLQFWQDALLQLKRANPINLPGVLRDVYRPLEVSYIYLESDEARDLFLLCCLFREDFNIPLETLAMYGMGLNIFEGIEDLEEARGRVQGLVEVLKDRFLLVDGESNRSTKMHDVVRDVAIFIATKDKKIFMVSHDASLRVWPRKKTYETITCISLISSKITQLPRGLYCPKIELLQVECDNQDLEVQDEFFDCMMKLQVLDMQGLSISSLPSSFRMLTNLQTLHLTNFRYLESISIISKLVNLEILNFCGSRIEELPEELGSLTNLRLLNLNDCSDLRTIAPGVISSFVHLEQLNMRSFSQWEAEGDGRKNAALIELESLADLTTLEIDVPDPGVFPSNLKLSSKLKRYALSMYCCSRSEGNIESIKISRFEKVVGLSLPFSISTPDAITDLLRGTEVLHLRGEGAANAVSKLIHEGLKCLKDLRINNCAMLEYLANTELYQPPITGVFSLMESLNLRSLGSLKEICQGQLPEGSFRDLKHLNLVGLPRLTKFAGSEAKNVSFTKLTSVYINGCENLRSLLSCSISRGLPELEKLQVINCRMITEVFSSKSEEDGETDQVMEFSGLNYLKYLELPL